MSTPMHRRPQNLGLNSFYERQAEIRRQADRRAERKAALIFLAVIVACLAVVVFILLPGAS